MSLPLNEDFKILRNAMSERRYRHTLGVRECALRLAQIFMPEACLEIEAAAMLHDIAKEKPKDELLLAIQKGEWQPPIEDLSSEALLHAYAAPYYIRRDFPQYATDSVLRAVYYHTVGRPEMTLPEKIVFLSDFIEPTRTYSACCEVRDWFFSELMTTDNREALLERALLRVLDFTVSFLIREEMYISPSSIHARNSILTTLSQC